jgi:phospho-N-acetylmuramoyl-pentapeptide-transferase
MRLIILSAGISMLVTLFFTPYLVKVLLRRGYSQAIKESGEHNYPEHSAKHGTPSMGGIAIVVGVALGYFGSHLLRGAPLTASGLLVLFLVAGLGLVGAADDYIKIFKQRSLGLRASTKFGGQAVVALAFGVLALQFKNDAGVAPASRAISIVRDTPVVLPSALLVLWVFLIVVASSNGVNLTDGLDGLAAGAAAMTFGAYTLLGLWKFGQACDVVTEATGSCYVARDPLDLAVVAAALMGACVGFLWWNAPPARIFMGDTGALALGGGVAGLAILSRTEVLLLFLGGLFVIITLSVILQVASFKMTGKRVFRMAPLQHHFELAGWSEETIVIRFWVINGLCIGAGLAIFYAEWVGG